MGINNRGGKREGAGAKKKPDKKIQVSFSLRPFLIKRLDQESPRTKNAVIEKALCEHYGIDLGE